MTDPTHPSEKTPVLIFTPATPPVFFCPLFELLFDFGTRKKNDKDDREYIKNNRIKQDRGRVLRDASALAPTGDLHRRDAEPPEDGKPLSINEYFTGRFPQQK